MMLCTWTADQPCRLVIRSSDGSSIESTQQNSSHEISHFLKSKVTISIEPIKSNCDPEVDPILSVLENDASDKSLKRKLNNRNAETMSLDIMTEDPEIEGPVKKSRREREHLRLQAIHKESVTKLVLDVYGKFKEDLIEVHEHIAKDLKPHQVEGIKFMYDSTIGNSFKLHKGYEGSGCILAHCMGLGKSFQVISFVHTLLTNNFTRQFIRNVLITVPINALKTWASEFDKWVASKELKTFKIHEIVNDINMEKRLERLERWKRKGGILIIGHSLLGNLINLVDTNNKKGSNLSPIEEVFCDPGPDIVIIDEGQRLKNPSTRLSKAVARMRTKRKIILTGNPLQNQQEDYHILMNVIKPHLKGSKVGLELANLIRNPTDLNDADGSALSKQKSNALHFIISSCIQRYDAQTLESFLQPKLEYAVFIRPTKLMAQMYNFYLDQVQRDKLLWNANSLRLCVNHPALYRLQKEREIAKQEAAAQRKQGKGKKSSLSDDSSESSESELDEPVDGPLKEDWYLQFVEADDWKNVELSGKFVLLFKILKSCILLGDKLLVVSQSLETLDLIERCLKYHKRIRVGNREEKIRWKLNKNYFRIDGGTNSKERHELSTQFNDSGNTEARLFLLSTKAGGIGIDLTGANRVIIFDVSWNPSDDIQAIFRVYRLGQVKPVYVYRFVAKDSMEEQIFDKQIIKMETAQPNVVKPQSKKTFKASELDELYSSRPKESYYSMALPHVPKDRLLADILLIDNKEVLDCTELNMLMEKAPEEELTEEGRKAAWDEYQKLFDAECREDDLALEREDELCKVLAEEGMKETTDDELVDKTEDTIQDNQVEDAAEDVKPVPTFIIDTVGAASPISSESSSSTGSETPAQTTESPLELAVPSPLPLPISSTPKPEALPETPSVHIPLSFSTGDCKELDDAFEIRPQSVPPENPTNASVPNNNAPEEKPPINRNPPENLIKPEKEAPSSVSVIVKSEVQKEKSKKRSEKQKKTPEEAQNVPKIPSNWLDISKIPIDAVLMVSATRNGFYQDGHTTAMVFRSIYGEFGQHKHEIIGIKHEEGYIRIYTNASARLKIKRELEEINESCQLEHKLIPDVRYPMIKFEWSHEINLQNQKETVDRIKRWNHWSGPVSWVGSQWSASIGKYRTALAITSRIRDEIEKENGTILLNSHRVKVQDEFNIIQCHRCSEFGHTSFNCKNYRRCGYCSRGHRSECKTRDPSKWKCSLCRGRGHSAFSKKCPVLIDYLKPKLEEIDHKYKYIFLDSDEKFSSKKSESIDC